MNKNAEQIWNVLSKLINKCHAFNNYFGNIGNKLKYKIKKL